MLAAICKSCWALRHDVEGKIVPGGNDASKEKGKKEETLRQNARPSLAEKKNWHGLSKNISREVFYFGPRNSCSPRSIMLETQGTLIPRPVVESAMSTPAKSKASWKNEIVVPDKLYFRIGEVSRLCRLPAYVLRFWETEFPQLKPVKSSTGQRMYRRKDVEAVLHIKKLLYEEGFTIAGARQQLRAEVAITKNQAPLPFPTHSASDLRRIRHGLQEILTMLSTRA
jgi:DNA-binding transcriptional MerR regulator